MTTLKLTFLYIGSMLSRQIFQAFGIYRVMDFTAQCGFFDVIFEYDIEQIIRILNGKDSIPNLYVGNIILGIKCGIGRFRRIAFSHVGGEGNRVAHKSAHHALNEPNMIWLEETPNCIVSEVLWDTLN